MELRQESSSNSTYKDVSNRQNLKKTTQLAMYPQYKSNSLSLPIHSHDLLCISLPSNYFLSYTNASDTMLYLLPFKTNVSDLWPSLFQILYMGDNTFSFLHEETGMYLTAITQSQLSQEKLMNAMWEHSQVSEQSCLQHLGLESWAKNTGPLGNEVKGCPRKNAEKKELFEETVPLTLQKKHNQNCLFRIRDQLPGEGYSYEVGYRLEHVKTGKFLKEPERDEKHPHLDVSVKKAACIYFKLFRVTDMENELNHPCLKYPYHLQNGDLVMLMNPTKTRYLVLLPKKELFSLRKADQRVEVYAKRGHKQGAYLSPENYLLTEVDYRKMTAENMIYALWQVNIVGMPAASSSPVINTRDNITFRHCLVKVNLVKNWSHVGCSLSQNFSVVQEEEEQGLSGAKNQQNSCFMIRNKENYIFDIKWDRVSKNWESKKGPDEPDRTIQATPPPSILFSQPGKAEPKNIYFGPDFCKENRITEQPIYLKGLIELDFKGLCFLTKANREEIKYIKWFAEDLEEFADILVRFASHSGVPEYLELASLKIVDRHPDEGEADKASHKEIDYDRLKKLIKKYVMIVETLISQGIRQASPCSDYIFSKIVDFLEALSFGLNGHSRYQLKIRKSPIIQPLIDCFLEYLINNMVIVRNPHPSSQPNNLEKQGLKEENEPVPITRNKDLSQYKKKLLNSLPNLYKVHPVATIKFTNFLSTVWNSPEILDKFISFKLSPKKISTSNKATAKPAEAPYCSEEEEEEEEKEEAEFEESENDLYLILLIDIIQRISLSEDGMALYRKNRRLRDLEELIGQYGASISLRKSDGPSKKWEEAEEYHLTILEHPVLGKCSETIHFLGNILSVRNMNILYFFKIAIFSHCYVLPSTISAPSHSEPNSLRTANVLASLLNAITLNQNRASTCRRPMIKHYMASPEGLLVACKRQSEFSVDSSGDYGCLEDVIVQESPKRIPKNARIKINASSEHKSSRCAESRKSEENPLGKLAQIEILNFFLIQYCSPIIETLENRNFVIATNSLVEGGSGQSLREEKEKSERKRNCAQNRCKVEFNIQPQDLSEEESVPLQEDINVYNLLSYEIPPNFVELLTVYLGHMIRDLRKWDKMLTLPSQGESWKPQGGRGGTIMKKMGHLISQEGNSQKNIGLDVPIVIKRRQNSMMKGGNQMEEGSRVEQGQEEQEQEELQQENLNFSQKIIKESKKMMEICSATQEKKSIVFMFDAITATLHLVDITCSIGFISCSFMSEIEEFVFDILSLLLLENTGEQVTGRRHTMRKSEYIFEKTAEKLIRNFARPTAGNEDLENWHKIGLKDFIVSLKVRYLVSALNDTMKTLLRTKKRLRFCPNLEQKDQALRNSTFISKYLSRLASIMSDIELGVEKQAGNSNSNQMKTMKMMKTMKKKQGLQVESSYKQRQENVEGKGGRIHKEGVEMGNESPQIHYDKFLKFLLSQEGEFIETLKSTLNFYLKVSHDHEEKIVLIKFMKLNQKPTLSDQIPKPSPHNDELQTKVAVKAENHDLIDLEPEIVSQEESSEMSSGTDEDEPNNLSCSRSASSKNPHIHPSYPPIGFDLKIKKEEFESEQFDSSKQPFEEEEDSSLQSEESPIKITQIQSNTRKTTFKQIHKKKSLKQSERGPCKEEEACQNSLQNSSQSLNQRQVNNFSGGNDFAGSHLILNIKKKGNRIKEKKSKVISEIKNSVKLDKESIKCKDGIKSACQQDLNEKVCQRMMALQSDAEFSHLIGSLKICEALAYDISMISHITKLLKNESAGVHKNLSSLIRSMKSLLDSINRKIGRLVTGVSPYVVEVSVEAYGLQGKLLEQVVCNEHFEEQFILEVVKFLCKFPPNIRHFFESAGSINYSLSLVKIVAKSLENYAKEPEEGSSEQEPEPEAPKIFKLVEGMHSTLNFKHFLMGVGIICEIYSTESFNERIYHFLLESLKKMASAESSPGLINNSTTFRAEAEPDNEDGEGENDPYSSYLMKKRVNKLISSPPIKESLENGLKAAEYNKKKINFQKPGIKITEEFSPLVRDRKSKIMGRENDFNMALDNRRDEDGKYETPGVRTKGELSQLEGLIKSLKTFETFRDFIGYPQTGVQDSNKHQLSYFLRNKVNETDSYFQNPKFWEISHYLQFLLFRLVGENPKIHKHFTQNICSHFTARQLVFDSTIEFRYKVSLTAHLRSDKEATKDEKIFEDYLNWVSQFLSLHSQPTQLDSFEMYLQEEDYQNKEYHQQILKATRARSKMKEDSRHANKLMQGSQAMANKKEVVIKDACSSQDEISYWRMLYSRPFHHKEEGVLIFLEQMVTDAPDFRIYAGRNSQDQQENINKAIISIYGCLYSLVNLTTKQFTRSEKENDQDIVTVRDLMWKTKKIMLLLHEKVPKLRDIPVESISIGRIGKKIAGLLLEYGLLKRFIKIFFYNQYKSMNKEGLPFSQRHSLEIENKMSDNSSSERDSEVSFKNSRSSRIHRNPFNVSVKITEKSLIRKTINNVSIEDFGLAENSSVGNQGSRPFLKEDYINENGNERSHHGLVSQGAGGESGGNIGYQGQKSMLQMGSKNTIQLNMSKMHHFQERSYTFYEVARLLEKVLQFTHDHTIRTMLEEQFVIYYRSGGNSTCLKQSIIKEVDEKRNDYLKEANPTRDTPFLNTQGSLPFRKAHYDRLPDQTKLERDLCLHSHRLSKARHLHLCWVIDLAITGEIGIVCLLLRKEISKLQFKKAETKDKPRPLSSCEELPLSPPEEFSQIKRLSRFIFELTNKKVANNGALKVQEYLEDLKILTLFLEVFALRKDMQSKRPLGKIEGESQWISEANLRRRLSAESNENILETFISDITGFLNKLMLEITCFSEEKLTHQQIIPYPKQETSKFKCYHKQTVGSQQKIQRPSKPKARQSESDYHLIFSDDKNNCLNGTHSSKTTDKVQQIFHYIIKLQCHLDTLVFKNFLEIPSSNEEDIKYSKVVRKCIRKNQQLKQIINRRVFPMLRGITIRYSLKNMLGVELEKLRLVLGRGRNKERRSEDLEAMVGMLRGKVAGSLIFYIKGLSLSSPNLLSSNIQVEEILKILSIFYDCLYLCLLYVLATKTGHNIITRVSPNCQVQLSQDRLEGRKQKRPEAIENWAVEILSRLNNKKLWESMFQLESKIIELFLAKRKDYSREDNKETKDSELGGRQHQSKKNERFSLLQKILYQSLNLYNIKFSLRESSLCQALAGVRKGLAGKPERSSTHCQEEILKFEDFLDIRVWTEDFNLPQKRGLMSGNLDYPQPHPDGEESGSKLDEQFMKSQKVPCSDSTNQQLQTSFDEMKTIQNYRQLFEVVTTVRVNLVRGQKEAMVSFFNHQAPNFFSRKVKKKEEKSAFFYKQFGKEWNESVQEKACKLADSKEDFAGKIYDISTYIMQIREEGHFSLPRVRRESLEGALIIISFLLILITNTLSLAMSQSRWKPPLLLLLLNLSILLVFTLIKAQNFWRIAKFQHFFRKKEMKGLAEQTSPQTSGTCSCLRENASVLRIMMGNEAAEVFLLCLLNLVNLLCLDYSFLLPLLFLVMLFKFKGYTTQIFQLTLRVYYSLLGLFYLTISVYVMTKIFNEIMQFSENLEITQREELAHKVTNVLGYRLETHNILAWKDIGISHILILMILMGIMPVIGANVKWFFLKRDIEEGNMKMNRLKKGKVQKYIDFVVSVELSSTCGPSKWQSTCELELMLRSKIQSKDSSLFEI